MDNTDSKSGVVDMTNRVLRVSLNKPMVKSSIRTVLQNIDPEAAPELARTILFEDTEMLLSLLGALPDAANTLIKLVDEILLQVIDKFPPELLAGFLESVLRDIDIDTLDRIKQNYTRLFDDLSPVVKQVFSKENLESEVTDG